MKIGVKHYQLLFWLAIIGIVFYVLGPILFPNAENLRQPELLPVYTLMLGLGQLFKGIEVNLSSKKNRNKNKDEDDDQS